MIATLTVDLIADLTFGMIPNRDSDEASDAVARSVARDSGIDFDAVRDMKIEVLKLSGSGTDSARLTGDAEMLEIIAEAFGLDRNDIV